MAFDDGEIRYKTSIDFEGTELEDALIRNLISANISTADMFFPQLMQFVSTNISPNDVLKTMAGE